jgi:succinate dehydrogenase/fumarate reductase flavoprotein subunit
MYDGNLVAERIASSGIGKQGEPKFDDSEFEAERKRLEALRRPLPTGGEDPMSIKQRLWDVMWTGMGPIKSGAGMQAALDVICGLPQILPTMGLKTTTRIARLRSHPCADPSVAFCRHHIQP